MKPFPGWRQLACVLLLCAAPPLSAQSGAAGGATATATANWPERPIRFVIPYPPGGNADTLGRVLAERLREHLKAPVVAENRPGATTQLGTEIVARAEPDGHTLLLAAATAFTVLPNLRKVPYDPANDFAIAGGVASIVPVIAVRKELGVGSLEQFIALARQNPGKYTFGSAGQASVGHIAAEIVKRAAGIDLLHVPYKGSNELITALAGGEIDLIIDGVGLGLATSGRAVAIATFAETRHPELPAVPTVAEAGLSVVVPASGFSVMAPRGTPAPVMARISAALEASLAEADTRDRLLRASLQTGWIPPLAYEQRLTTTRTYFADLLKTIDGVTR